MSYTFEKWLPVEAWRNVTKEIVEKYNAAIEIIVCGKPLTIKAPVEMSEDIEILRFVEKGFKVCMTETTFSSYSVDTPDNIKKIESY